MFISPKYMYKLTISFIEIYPNIVKRGNSCCLFGLKEKNKFTPNMMHDTTSTRKNWWENG